MIRINLLPHKASKPTGVYFQLAAAGAALMVTIVAVVFFTIHYNSVIENKKIEIARKQQLVNELQIIIDQVLQFERDKAALKSKLETISRLRAEQKGPVTLLDQVSRNLPDHIWLTFVEKVREKVTVKGLSLYETSISDFMTALENSPAFEEVRLGPVRQQKRRNAEVYDFSITFRSHAEM